MGEHAVYGCDGLSFLAGKELCLEPFLSTFSLVRCGIAEEMSEAGRGELERVR